MHTQAWSLVAARFERGRDRWIAGRFMDGLGASGGCYTPSGEGAAKPSGVLRALMHWPVRVLADLRVRTALGGSQSPPGYHAG